MKPYLFLCVLFVFKNYFAYANEHSSCPNKNVTMEFNIPQENNSSSEYFNELLKQSLEEVGCNFKINNAGLLPRTRAWRDLKKGSINIYWGVPTPERKKDYIHIKNYLTNSILANRLLIVNKTSVDDYKDVKKIQDFKNLHKKAGVISVWGDVLFLQNNNCETSVYEGEPDKLYALAAQKNSNVDYVPALPFDAQGVVSKFKTQGISLAVEPKLRLVFSGIDTQFFIIKKNKDYKYNLEFALNYSDKSGLKQKLIEKYFGDLLHHVDFDKRIEIKFQKPNDF